MIELIEMDMVASILTESATITVTYASNIEVAKCPFTLAFRDIVTEVRQKLLKGLYGAYREPNHILADLGGEGNLQPIGYITFKHSASCLLKDANSPFYMFRLTFVFSKSKTPNLDELEWLKLIDETVSGISQK